MRGVGDHVFTGQVQFRVACHGIDLRLARHLQPINSVEGLRDIGARHQKAMVSQDHGITIAQVRHQPLPFLRVDGRAFVIVIRINQTA